MSALLFIDTNIYLDFYRVRGSGTSLSMLKHFAGNLDRIITTTEVEMEYKKNRQSVILLSLNSIKPGDIGNIIVPDFLKESQLNTSLINTRKQLVQKINKLRDRTSKLLEDPSSYDPVYKVLQRLFKAREKCHLYRTHDRKLRDEIRNLAQKRFMLGYPPKKDRDLSINDAINWEWIIYCAKNCNSDIVIVSRDSDYGIVSSGDAILNDWLRQEFKERVRNKRSIILTNRLAEGFKRASIQVTKQEEEEEQRHIQTTWQTVAGTNWGNILSNAAVANIADGTNWGNILSNAAVANIADGTNWANILSNAAVANIADGTNWGNILSNAAAASIPTDTPLEDITKTTQESHQEDKEEENDTT